jgi:hypothetical protein
MTGWASFFRGWTDQVCLQAQEITRGLAQFARRLFTPPQVGNIAILSGAKSGAGAL